MMIRNRLFDWGLLKSKKFDVPVVSIGNLSLGGTGKTPHVEYLIRLLTGRYPIATLSRGYGRTSKGFVIGTKESTVKLVGDEPLQYVRKFERIRVVVDENRCRGVRSLLEKFPETGVVLLDDAFQHRWIKPGFSILLTDHFHLYTEDRVVPSGRLREFSRGASRADCIIVTKTPKIFSPISRRRIIDELKPKPHQQVFFSYIRYLDPVPLRKDEPVPIPPKLSFILLFTGIADNELLQEHLGRLCNDLTTIKFGDHHKYSKEDLQRIQKTYDGLPTQKKLLVTTEKDAMRLGLPELEPILSTMPIYYIPIEVELHEPDKQPFDQLILEYVKKNKRDY